jgi:hypothetical protein
MILCFDYISHEWLLGNIQTDKSILSKWLKGKFYGPKVYLVRYADGFVVTADKRETLEGIRILLTEFLSERALSLSEEKTLITNITEGFDFYFKSDGRRKWCFMQKLKEADTITTFVLRKLADIPIIRHVKIKKDANPFDSAWDAYFEERRMKRLRLSRTLRRRQLIGLVPV